MFQVKLPWVHVFEVLEQGGNILNKINQIISQITIDPYPVSIS